MRDGAWGASLVLLALFLLPLSGCRTVVDTLAAVVGPGEVGGAVDAHVVYRLRDDCPTLLARTIDHEYTVMTPLGLLAQGDPLPLVEPIEETGVFEGPVRTGQSIFRYVSPGTSHTWGGDPVDIVADVSAVRLTVDEAAARLVEICGPAPTPVTSDPAVPRLPPTQR